MSGAMDMVLAPFDGALGDRRRLRLPRALLATASVLVLILMIWATLAPVDKVVRTQGRIVPSVKPQLVQHLEGGIVSTVFVREGDVVAKGASLVAVSDLMANSSRGEKRARLNGMKARIARLSAEADGLSRVGLPSGLPANAAEVLSETDAFTARQGRLRQSRRVLEEQLAQKRQESTELGARRKGLAAEAEVARQQLALVSTMMSRNAASQFELLEAQARVERLGTQVREAETALPRLASAASELQARLAEIGAQFRSEAQSALTETRVELQRLEQDMTAEDDRVNRTVVTAPVAGTVNKLLANTVGGVIRPGETLLELTPADGAVVIESRATPAERGPLQVGQRAVVRVAAFDYTVFGTLPARITEISADSLTDERGERYFRIGLLVDAASQRSFDRPLTPGSAVTADLVTGQRTVAQYLLSPLRGLASTAFRDRH
ncbi:HlyD family type I secretion periplasmic adaptor subunit [Actimicrobium antarcticum]|uniref:Membrane fusion protein (MFP) family protein n=1 Tax=Actimicrobium antarcticum TaxID=1051899 RepID=A0ABP7SZ07_9BURK